MIFLSFLLLYDKFNLVIMENFISQNYLGIMKTVDPRTG